jgi:hypothetical protein
MHAPPCLGFSDSQVGVNKHVVENSQKTLQDDEDNN